MGGKKHHVYWDAEYQCIRQAFEGVFTQKDATEFLHRAEGLYGQHPKANLLIDASKLKDIEHGAQEIIVEFLKKEVPFKVAITFEKKQPSILLKHYFL